MEPLSQAKQHLRQMAIVIPYKDTPSRLNEVLQDIEQLLIHPSYAQTMVLLFDDASETPLVETDLHPQIHIHRLHRNQGYGAVQKQAFDIILQSHNFEFVILLHGDNQYHLEDLLEVVQAIEIHDFGILSRMTKKNALQNHPFLRRISNHFLTGLVNFQMHTNYRDLHSGGRVYRSSILRKIPYHKFSNDFFFDQQMLLFLLQQNASGIEYPITADYSMGSSSISYPRAVKYALQCIKTVIIPDTILKHKS
jgi:glycosyltransferase involved in cell wall biosynthesis